jgi:hypothetical protein
MSAKKWERSHTAGFARFRPTPAELRALARAIPPDTRDVTARLCGDPLPGRSALDRREEAGVDTWELLGDAAMRVVAKLERTRKRVA